MAHTIGVSYSRKEIAIEHGAEFDLSCFIRCGRQIRGLMVSRFSQPRLFENPREVWISVGRYNVLQQMAYAEALALDAGAIHLYVCNDGFGSSFAYIGIHHVIGNSMERGDILQARAAYKEIYAGSQDPPLVCQIIFLTGPHIG
jgi:hypothetical protein